MHETALVMHLLRRIVHEADAAGADRVTVVRLRIGELGGIESSLLADAFQRLSPGTPAEGAQLEITAVPLEAACESCGHQFRVEQFRFQCPSCEGVRTRVVAGEELELESLSVSSAPEVSTMVMMP